MKKVRSQILLTKELKKDVRTLAKKQGISISKAIRLLLSQALGSTKSQDIDSSGKTVQKDLMELSEYHDKNPRIRGLSELFSVGATIPPVAVISDGLFKKYKKNNKFTEKFRINFSNKANEFAKHSLNGTLVLRRAYVVPGLENPPGPRYLGIQPKDIEARLKDLYQFAMDHSYEKSKKSQIVAFLHPFVDPKPLELPITMEQQLPYGGSAVPVTEDARRVEIFAVWGNNEGVQSFDAIDRYLVDVERMIIISKNIPQKTSMFATTKKEQSEKIGVPLHAQFQQVLSDFEILEAARIVRELSRKYGLRRIEFSFDGKDKLSYNESAPYELIALSQGNISKKGVVTTVKNAKDLDSVRGIDPDSNIVYIHPEVVEQRAYEVLNLIAGLKSKFMVLYPGLSATAHAMRVLSDFGHIAVVVGNRKFVDGDELKVEIQQGEVKIENLAKRKFEQYAMNLYDAKLFGADSVGGKAMNLSLLKSKGINIPHGIVLTTDLFDHSDSGRAEVDANIWEGICADFGLDKKKSYAVRSSATVEDHQAHAFAGQFDSFLNVPFKNLRNKIEKVMKSTFNKSVKGYFKAMDLKFDVKMGVVVQEMVDARKSGVVFGKDLQTRDADILVIDAAWGLADGVVDGVVATERIHFSKSKNEKLKSDRGEIRGQVLSQEELKALVHMSANIEEIMGEPQDIEWAIDKAGSLWVVQSRSL